MRYLLAFAFLLCLTGCKTNVAPEQQVNDIEITAEVKKKLATDLGLKTVTNIFCQLDQRRGDALGSGGQRAQ